MEDFAAEQLGPLQIHLGFVWDLDSGVPLTHIQSGN